MRIISSSRAASRQVELEQRGGLEHAETPLVRIRDERDPLVAKERDPFVGVVRCSGGVDFHRRHQATIGGEATEEPGFGEYVPLGAGLLAEAAKHRSVAQENPGIPIPK